MRYLYPGACVAIGVARPILDLLATPVGVRPACLLRTAGRMRHPSRDAKRTSNHLPGGTRMHRMRCASHKGMRAIAALVALLVLSAAFSACMRMNSMKRWDISPMLVLRWTSAMESGGWECENCQRSGQGMSMRIDLTARR